MHISKKTMTAIIASALACAIIAALIFSGTIGSVYRAIAHKPDKDGFYTVKGYTAEAIGEVSDKAITRFVDKLNAVREQYLTSDNKLYFALIPDKTFYIDGYETADYLKLQAKINKGLEQFNIIDIYPLLSLEDYYKTDGHWRQERLLPVADKLCVAMGGEGGDMQYTQCVKEDFVGAYKSHIRGKVAGESLVYLTNAITDSATQDNYEAKGNTAVYDVQRLDSKLPYDVFLSGASPFITVTSPLARTDKELVIFRDSFAGALTPLLLHEYHTITLVDLRYMATPLLKDMLSLDKQDVLFIYSTNIVKNSAILR